MPGHFKLVKIDIDIVQGLKNANRTQNHEQIRTGLQIFEQALVEPPF
jgi:hypothetical protein